MRTTDRQGGDYLQLHAVVWVGGTLPSARQRQGVGLAQIDLTSGVAASALLRASSDNYAFKNESNPIDLEEILAAIA